MARNKAWIVVIGLIMVGLATVFLLPRKSSEVICRETGEVLSDEQYIERAVEAVLENYPGSIRVPTEQALIVNENAIPYKNVGEFLAENPSCCTFSQHGLDGFPMPPKSRSGEDLAGFVIIRHQIKYRNPSDGNPDEVQRAEAYPSQYLMDACGAIQPVY